MPERSRNEGSTPGDAVVGTPGPTGTRGTITEEPLGLSETPATTPGVVAEGEVALSVDAVVADRGGAAASDGTAATASAPSGKKRRFGPLFWICIGWLGLLLIATVVADLLPLADTRERVGSPRLGFGQGGEILGTDENGRSILARVVYAARVSLVVGFASILFGMVVGGTLGVIAGYFRGRLETLIMGAMDVLLAFPALILALAIITFRGQTLFNVTLAIGILAIAPIARIIRASTLTFAEREFVQAARTLGAKDSRIIVREILPNVVPPALSFSLIFVAVAIVAEGALAFIGLSVPPPTPTWGSMINEGRDRLADAPFISFVPAVALFLTVLALNFAGDALRGRFEIRESGI